MDIYLPRILIMRRELLRMKEDEENHVDANCYAIAPCLIRVALESRWHARRAGNDKCLHETVPLLVSSMV
jgi:hypothetical protein